jgi:CheY-specific phosphatase CheX
MQPSELEQMLAGSTSEVLETMFFTTVDEIVDGPATEDEQWVSAGLPFQGEPSGRFSVRASVRTASVLAASFLGRDEQELLPQHAGEVICELTNMVCGSMLSRLESKAHFELLTPELNTWESEGPVGAEVVSCTFRLEEGILGVRLELGG